MKLKKIMIFLVLFFIGALCSKAMDENALYNNYEQYYRLIASETYYYNYSATAGKISEMPEVDLAQLWFEAANKFNPLPHADNRTQLLAAIYESGFGEGGSSSEFVRRINATLNEYQELDLTDSEVADAINKYANELASYETLPEMLRYTQFSIKNVSSSSGLTNRYNELTETTKNAYSSFCEYLKNHKGISYYIKTVLQIISYAVLGLAVILGGIDFVGAILSNEDNALNKAFQKFVRRLIAATLVFLAYVIVQIFLGLVTSLPGVDAANTEICSELKIGAFK